MSRFTKIKQIRRAGQGDVWVSLDEATANVVAQKFLVLSGNCKIDETAHRRFEREVRSQAKLIAPSIMQILDFDFNESPPWYTMPLAQGSLEDRLVTKTPLSTIELAALSSSVFDALDIAHKRGVVHRDLKPANLLQVEGPGRQDWVVADFGLCRDVRSNSPNLTRSGVELGTTRYMAPEQSEDPHNVGPTADIYSLGCVLYQCLTGELPGIRQLDYARLPSQYREVIGRATALHRQRRHKSAREFQREFEAVLNSGRKLAVNVNLLSESKEPRGRLAAIARIRPDLNSLTSTAFAGFVEDLARSLSYRVIANDEGGHVAFYVEDIDRGVGPVIARQRLFNCASSDLLHTQLAMTAQQCRFSLFVTTGRLSREAKQFADANKQIIVIDGPSLQLHIDSHRAWTTHISSSRPSTIPDAG